MRYTTPNPKSTHMSRIALILILSLSVTTRFAWAQADKPQASNAKNALCLDSSLVQEGAKTDGITDPANPDKFSKSLTSANNFLQFCAGKKLTNGKQIPDGSCNPTPMGMIPSSKHMPAVRIVSPSATTKIAAHKDFNVVVAVRNIETGFFTSPENTYYLAPQQLNNKGVIKGHLHLVIQLVFGTQPLSPRKFVFFKGIPDTAVSGKVNATITGGLPDGTYRISTITSAMNHQVVALPIAKRGAVEDALYIQVGTGISAPEKSGGEKGASDSSKLNEASKNDQGGSKQIKGEASEKGSGDKLENSLPTNNPSSKNTHRKRVCKAKKRRRSVTSKSKLKR